MELPIYDNVVKRVEEISKIEKHPTFDQYQIFGWAPGISIMEYMREMRMRNQMKKILKVNS